jgi:hypothetical protein
MRSNIRTLALVLVGGMLAGIGFTGAQAIADSFTDVPSGSFFAADIDWLTDYDIANGFPDGTFRPNANIKRQQAAQWLHRLSSLTTTFNESSDPGPSTQFSQSATCQGDLRAIAGGGSIEGANALMTSSYPASDNTWNVQWRSDDGATLDPSLIRTFVTCVPRL